MASNPSRPEDAHLTSPTHFISPTNLSPNTAHASFSSALASPALPSPSHASTLLASDDDRIAVELPIFSPSHAPSESSQIERTSDQIRLHLPSGASSLRFQGSGWYNSFRRGWERHVSIKVASDKRRDHLALERTFLGYLRTSLALSVAGIVIAQLLLLGEPEGKSLGNGPVVGGVPLATAFICGSLVVVLTGAIRFWRQQTAMVRGKVWAGGPELLFVVGVVLALSIAMLAILAVQDD